MKVLYRVGRTDILFSFSVVRETGNSLIVRGPNESLYPGELLVRPSGAGYRSDSDSFWLTKKEAWEERKRKLEETLARAAKTEEAATEELKNVEKRLELLAKAEQQSPRSILLPNGGVMLLESGQTYAGTFVDEQERYILIVAGRADAYMPWASASKWVSGLGADLPTAAELAFIKVNCPEVVQEVVKGTLYWTNCRLFGDYFEAYSATEGACRLPKSFSAGVIAVLRRAW